MSNLIDNIADLMASDDVNRETQSGYLLKTYNESQDKNSIDNFCIALCGYSFETIINNN